MVLALLRSKSRRGRGCTAHGLRQSARRKSSLQREVLVSHLVVLDHPKHGRRFRPVVASASPAGGPLAVGEAAPRKRRRSSERGLDQRSPGGAFSAPTGGTSPDLLSGSDAQGLARPRRRSSLCGGSRSSSGSEASTLLDYIDESREFTFSELGRAQLIQMAEVEGVSEMHDRLIAAEALVWQAPIITADEALRRSRSVEVIW